MDFSEATVLGRTGLRVGRLGISSSWKAPAAAFEEAFERGCNYFTWGTFIKGRSPEMMKAIRNICKGGGRERLVVAMFTYAHMAYLGEKFFVKGLRSLGIDHADVLLLGYYQRKPARRIIDRALELKRRGLVRFIGISSHNRKLFPVLCADGVIDVFHVRYNAAHRGAETDVFEHLPEENRPGIVSFTATRWGQLLNQKKMPPGETAPSAVDCYRFVLSNPAVNVCMTGTRDLEQMRQNLRTLEQGPMSEDELSRMRRIGDHLHG